MRAFWNKADYERQWRAAVERVLNRGRSALITSMVDPDTMNFVRWWPMYRVADEVFFQEHLLFREQVVGRFDPACPENFLRDRTTVSEEGEKISEWKTTTAALSSFIARSV